MVKVQRLFAKTNLKNPFLKLENRKLAATIKKGKTSTWTDTKVKKGKKYRYYVRAYVKEPNGVVKGKYKASAAVTRK